MRRDQDDKTNLNPLDRKYLVLYGAIWFSVSSFLFWPPFLMHAAIVTACALFIYYAVPNPEGFVATSLVNVVACVLSAALFTHLINPSAFFWETWLMFFGWSLITSVVAYTLQMLVFALVLYLKR